MKTLIIDDEENAQLILASLLGQYCPDIQVISTANNIEDSVKAIRELKPGLIFMDIELHNTLSFQILEKLEETNFELIFTTAHSQYALKAIKYAAIDYLLKPIDADDLQEAVAKVLKRSRTNHNNLKIENLLSHFKELKAKKITLSTAQEILYISLEEIIHCEADGGYTHFYLSDKRKITTTKSLGDYEEILLPEGFLRIHHAHLVNIKHVKRFVKPDELLVMTNDSTVPVSFRKKTEILARLANYNML